MADTAGSVHFSDLRLHPLDSLQSAERVKCGSCGTSRRYWCGLCAIPLVSDTPVVRLPLQVHILQAAAETPQKSTAQHAQILAPGHAKVWRPYPECLREFCANVVDGKPLGTVAVLYPTDDAITAEEASQQFPELSTLVVIDGSWSKSVAMMQTLQLANLPHLKLSPSVPGVDRCTRFWRYSPVRNKGSKMFNEHSVKGLLSTIEAIHAFCTAYGCAKGVSPGAYDNLLWLFVFNYSRVKEVYEAAPGKRDRIMRKSKGLLREF